MVKKNKDDTNYDPYPACFLSLFLPKRHMFLKTPKTSHHYPYKRSVLYYAVIQIGELSTQTVHEIYIPFSITASTHFMKTFCVQQQSQYPHRTESVENT